MRPLISVIIPAYRVEPYLEQCVRSVLRQTWEDLEILLVDDGSPDRCGEIVDSFAAADPRVRAIHQENAGLSAARNAALLACSGTYVVFVDGDDWAEPEMLRTAVQAIEQYEADVCCFGFYRDFGERKEPSSIASEPVCYGEEEILLQQFRGRFAPYVWNKLWRRALFTRDALFPVGRVYEDMASNWKRMENCRRVVCIPGCFYHYRQNPQSVTHTRSMKNLCDRWYALKERFDAFSGEEGELRRVCVRDCLSQSAYAWRWLYAVPAADRAAYQAEIDEMTDFARRYGPQAKDLGCSRVERIGIFLASHPGRASMAAGYRLNQIYRRKKGLM